MSKDEKIVHSDEDELDESYEADENTSGLEFDSEELQSVEAEDVESQSDDNGAEEEQMKKDKQSEKHKKHSSTNGENSGDIFNNESLADDKTVEVEPEIIPATVAKELEDAKASAEEFKRKWVAVTAEYENYRKRNQMSVSQAYADGKAEAVKKLLPVADTFGYAYDGASDEKTKAGIDKIIKNFNSILSSLGIEEIVINAGDKFDESVAEAIMNIPCKEGEKPNCVSQVLKKGYKQGDKVIRFAQVVVTIE
jgi:molecular chaperone GrpE